MVCVIIVLLVFKSYIHNIPIAYRYISFFLERKTYEGISMAVASVVGAKSLRYKEGQLFTICLFTI